RIFFPDRFTPSGRGQSPASAIATQRNRIEKGEVHDVEFLFANIDRTSGFGPMSVMRWRICSVIKITALRRLYHKRVYANPTQGSAGPRPKRHKIDKKSHRTSLPHRRIWPNHQCLSIP